MTTTQRLAELKSLANQAKTNLFRRIQLAAEVLADADWIGRVHDGSDTKAQDVIQDEYFSELSEYLTLGTLLAIYRAFPDEAVWGKYKYNLAAMELLYQEQVKSSDEQKPAATRMHWKTEAAKLADQLKTVEADKRMASDLSERQASELETLRQRVQQLERENAGLLGRIEELERMTKMRLAA